MKKLLSLLFILTFTFNFAKAEEIPLKDVIKWSYDIEYLDNNEAYVIATAKLYHHFHLFSIIHNDLEYDFTGTPTSFNFSPSDNYSLIGKVRENKPKMGSDETGNYVWHTEKGVFKQKIKLNSNKDFKLDFKISWQVCNDVMCHIPQEDEVSLNISPKSKQSAQVETGKKEPTSEETTDETLEQNTSDESAIQSAATCDMPVELNEYPVKFGLRATVEEDSSSFELMFILKTEDGWKTPTGFDSKMDSVLIQLKDSPNYELVGGLIAPDTSFTYFDSILDSEISYYPNGSKWIQKIKTKKAEFPIVKGNASLSALSDKEFLASENKGFVFNLKDAKLRIKDDSSSDSYWTIFIIAFLSGFTALLTPCVFPMIPMTVSFFTKQSKTKAQGIRNAIIYAVSIIAIYVLLGLGVTLTFGTAALNELSTNVIFNIFFFLLLVVFGASFLGAFEIRLPSSWINRADKNADKGGLIGIFFMAFTLALVSFSCTGPIIGTLLVEAVDEGVMGPFFGMLGFSLALALPFALFAMFPGWLNSLPQSGGWLNSVKVVLGLLEIALAFKFLSNADLVVQAHLIEREVFLAIWIVIFALIGLYLLGKLKFSHDSPLPFISVTRLFISIIIFSFVVYMIPGLWGAPVKLLSGFLPPQHYSEIPYGILGKPDEKKLPPHAHAGPHGITVFHDKKYAVEYAAEVNKPIMLDYTGHACINCRKMEDQVWSQEVIKEILQDSIIVVSLHVDEKLALPIEDQFKDDNGDLLTTVGEKWSYDQRVKYGSQTQPLYVLVDENEEKLMPTTSYDPDVDLFKNWLDKGIEEYMDRKNMQSVNAASITIPKSCIKVGEPQNYGDLYFKIYDEKYIPLF